MERVQGGNSQTEKKRERGLRLLNKSYLNLKRDERERERDTERE